MKEDFDTFYNNCLQDDDLYLEWERTKKKRSKRLKIASVVIIIIIDVIIICFFNRFFISEGVISDFKMINFILIINI